MPLKIWKFGKDKKLYLNLLLFSVWPDVTVPLLLNWSSVCNGLMRGLSEPSATLPCAHQVRENTGRAAQQGILKDVWIPWEEIVLENQMASLLWSLWVTKPWCDWIVLLEGWLGSRCAQEPLPVIFGLVPVFIIIYLFVHFPSCRTFSHFVQTGRCRRHCGTHGLRGRRGFTLGRKGVMQSAVCTSWGPWLCL